MRAGLPDHHRRPIQGHAMNTDNTKGCADCEHATRRFNGGRGATTCAKLRDRIVAVGDTPTERPDACPVLPSDP